jgi:hypothetical protein
MAPVKKVAGVWDNYSGDALNALEVSMVGMKVKAVEFHREGVTIFFEDGTEVEGDILLSRRAFKIAGISKQKGRFVCR